MKGKVYEFGDKKDDVIDGPGKDYNVAPKAPKVVSKTTTTTTGRCYESHKPLDLGNGLSVQGGSCSNPVPDLDIYVALDSWSSRDRIAYPWNPPPKEIRVQFPITDMAAPSDAEEFKKMINWLAEQIKAGKKVHVGCIGGHGRTGTVLAALVKVMTGEADAISYVRKNYCDRAVESGEQVAFLHKHFGIVKQKGAKSSVVWSGGSTSGKGTQSTLWPSHGRDSDDLEGWSDRHFGSTSTAKEPPWAGVKNKGSQTNVHYKGSSDPISPGVGQFAVSGGPTRTVAAATVPGHIWGEAVD